MKARKKKIDLSKECTEKSSRFEEPIKKVKILNFAVENILKKNKSKQVSETANIKGTCDMFGKL